MAPTERIPTNLRTLLILEIVAKSDKALTATEINGDLDLPKQTVHRLVNTLEREGFLVREQSGNRYRASRRTRQMASGLLNSSRVHLARHQILADVSDRLRESVNFVVPDETGMHYLDRVETDWPFRIQLPIGSNVPFHCTASGKCFMASLGKSAREKLLASLTLTEMTKNTRTEVDVLLKELADCARQGYALDDEEFIDDMVAVAVPVTDPQGRFVAALATHGPVQRLTLDIARENRFVLMDAAEKLTDALFS